MVLSMTGFGKAESTFDNKKIIVEMKSLNSKLLDLSVRLPGVYKSMEIDLKNRISSKVERGKVDLLIYIDNSTDDFRIKINKELALNYYKDLIELTKEIGINESSDMMSLLLKMPDIMKQERQELNEEEWNQILKTVEVACENLTEFRKAEGKNLEIELKNRIKLIDEKLAKVIENDTDRITNIKDRIKQSLEDSVGRANIDNNRFEQELIFYLEKLDITEEKVRLKTHLNYFIEVMDDEMMQGKKLGFITQELGREINTIGSKANNAGIQKIVVEMKDELEKIKEQILNLL